MLISNIYVLLSDYHCDVYTVFHKKMEPFIFDYNFRISWSIFIILLRMETGVNTPQSNVIYLRKC